MSTATGIDSVLAEVSSTQVFPLVEDGGGNVARVDDGLPPAVFAPRNGSFEGGVTGGVPSDWTVQTIPPQNGTWTLDPAVAYASGQGFASRYGIPAENIKTWNFIESATLRPGSPFVTRQAPAVGQNVGGGIEVVVPEGGVTLRSFSHLGN